MTTGRMNQKEGSGWEKRIKLDCDLQNYMCGKFPVETRSPGGRMFRVKSFVDYVIAIDGLATFLDAKVCSESVCNIKKYLVPEDKTHQLGILMKAERTGSRGGFLINFKEFRKVVWVTATQVVEFINSNVYVIHPETEGVRVCEYGELLDFKYLFFGVKRE